MTDTTKLEKSIDKLLNKIKIMQNMLGLYKNRLILDIKSADGETKKHLERKIRSINSLL